MPIHTANYEECYKILELEFGAALSEINKAWRRLSMIHHPDKHNTNPARYQKALEQQKKINNARDVLRKWFDQNPGAVPPRPAPAAGERSSSTQETSGSNRSRAEKQGQSRQQEYSWNDTRRGSDRSHTGGGYRKSGSDPYNWFRDCTPPQPKTGWFTPPAQSMTFLQKLIKKLDSILEDPNIVGDPVFPALFLFMVGLLVPAYAYASAINLIFPEMAGHYPDWLAGGVLVAGIGTTVGFFWWYFIESELIKLQDQVFYYETTGKPDDLIIRLKEILARNSRENAVWRFSTTGAISCAELIFDEEIIPDVLRSRKIRLLFQVKRAGTTSILAVSFRVSSPVHSFACNKIVRAILKDLKATYTLLD